MQSDLHQNQFFKFFFITSDEINLEKRWISVFYTLSIILKWYFQKSEISYSEIKYLNIFNTVHITCN